MAPAEILGRLDARFRLLRGGPRQGLERHRTLHAAFQWSYGLLDEAEQRLFRQLSVFGGGCSAGQVMAVCASDDVGVMDEFDVVDVLDRLVARSLLVADRSGPTTRYRLLESLRQFGEDALQGAGESAATRTRHAAHFLVLAEAARRRQSSLEAAEAAATLERDWDNFRAAVDWCTVTKDVDGALRLIIAIWWHAWFSLHYELAAWAHTAITLSEARHDPHWPGVAGAAATLDWAAGDLEAAASLASQAIAVAGEQGQRDVYEPHLALACAAWFLGDPARAVAAVDAIERTAAEHADPLEIGMAGLCRGVAVQGLDAESGDAEGAHKMATQLVDSAQRRANPYELALAYLALLQACAVGGRRDEGQAAYWQVRRWAQQTNNLFTVGQAITAVAALSSGPVESLELLSEAITTFRGVDWAQLGQALLVALVHLAGIDCTETVATAYGAWCRWYPHGTIRYLDGDRARLERSFEAVFGLRLPVLYEKGAVWTRLELPKRILDEIDLTLQTINTQE
jgi:hypothetical protein